MRSEDCPTPTRTGVRGSRSAMVTSAPALCGDGCRSRSGAGSAGAGTAPAPADRSGAAGLGDEGGELAESLLAVGDELAGDVAGGADGGEGAHDLADEEGLELLGALVAGRRGRVDAVPR